MNIDFPITEISIPEPKEIILFGHKIILNLPPGLFRIIEIMIPGQNDAIIMAELANFIPNIAVPTTYKSVFDESVRFKQRPIQDSISYKENSVYFLSTVFPRFKMNSKQVFESFKFDLCNTIFYFENKQRSLCPQDDQFHPKVVEILNSYASYQIFNFAHYYAKNIPQNPYKTQKTETDLIMDSIFIQPFKDQPNILTAASIKSETKKQLNIIRLQKKIKQLAEDEEFAAKLQQQFDAEPPPGVPTENDEMECSCCFTPSPFTEMVQCLEGHLVCKQCVILSVETALAEGYIRSTCPSMGCTSTIPLVELERVLPAKVMQRFNETDSINEISKAKITGLRTCWKCGFKAIDENDSGPFVCPQCAELTCKQCSQQYHYNSICDFKQRMIEDRMSQAIVKACPSCGTRYIKVEGCNHMICPRCNTEFCYLCGEIIHNVEDHYTTCTQFIDNEEYLQQQIDEAVRTAMEDLS